MRPDNKTGMIRAIKIRNFQRHRARKIVFSKGITTIQGRTDIGKSAIIRAIRWAALNDFKGAGFLRRGAKDAIVKLRVDGHTVTRRKGKGGNIYKLDRRTFRAFNNKVPEDIKKLLRLDPLNFQRQFDRHFWIGDNAAQVSRELNKVIDLSIIDLSLTNISKAVRASQARRDVCEERIAELNQDLSDLEVQRERIEAYSRIQEAHEELTTVKEAADRLDELLTSARANQSRSLVEEADEGEAVVSAFGDFLRSQTRIERLAALIAELEHHCEKVEPPDIGPIEEAFDEWMKGQYVVAGLTDAIDDLYQEQINFRAIEKEAQQLEKKLSRSPIGLCPTCKQPWPYQ